MKSTVAFQQCFSITAQNKKQGKGCLGGVNNKWRRTIQYWKINLKPLTLSFRLLHILFLWSFSILTKSE